MLDLIETVYYKIKDLNSSGLTIYNDSWNLHRMITVENLTKSMHIDKVGAEVARIRKIVKEATIMIEF